MKGMCKTIKYRIMWTKFISRNMRFLKERLYIFDKGIRVCARMRVCEDRCRYPGLLFCSEAAWKAMQTFLILLAPMLELLPINWFCSWCGSLSLLRSSHPSDDNRRLMPKIISKNNCGNKRHIHVWRSKKGNTEEANKLPGRKEWKLKF